MPSRSPDDRCAHDRPDDRPVPRARFGLLQATALNMSNMIGIGPFITIPLLMSALAGRRRCSGGLSPWSS